MKIACVTSRARGGTDLLLSNMAARLQTVGVRLAGIVKDESYVSGFDNGCDMKVRVLPDGPIIKITQSLGQGSDACRLDPSAIAEAVSKVEASEMEKADLFILNKFGPEEAAGRGFVSAIGQALELGIPVLVGVGPAATEAFNSFADGLAITLPDDLDAIGDWCDASLGKDRKVSET